MKTKTVNTPMSGFENPDTNPFFYIPLLERRVQTKRSPSDAPWKYIAVNYGRTGLYLQSGKEDIIPKEKLLQWARLNIKIRTHCIIQAPNVKEAIRKFYKNYPGAKIGKRHPALTIDRKNKIVELPYCGLLYVGKQTGRFMCGPPVKDGTGSDKCEFGGCVLDGISDHPDESCALKDFPTHYFNFRNEFKSKKSVKIIVDGKNYLFISLRKKITQTTLKTT